MRIGHLVILSLATLGLACSDGTAVIPGEQPSDAGDDGTDGAMEGVMTSPDGDAGSDGTPTGGIETGMSGMEIPEDPPPFPLPPDSFKPQSYVTNEGAADRFAVATGGQPAPLVMSSADFAGVERVAGHLQDDVERVTGVRPTLALDTVPQVPNLIVIGTLGESPLVDQLVADGRLDVTEVQGRWETFVLQAVDAPFPGVQRALVIAGSDKRGTIYGMFDLSREMGVSPWYWWADVPARQNTEVFVLPGAHTKGEPAVKYRGIFINDEAPALSGWAYEKFNGFNSQFYERVFELVLRLKGNYLWPAMWGRAFNDDDPQNPALADELGIVMGTSHHEPMSRSQDEWARYGGGDWNYETNAQTLNTFWLNGIQRMGARETIVTIGMRGDGDEALSAEADIAVLENIVANQRRLIGQALPGRPIETIPQVWTLYKEVQDYYDMGMRVPDDVILMFSDDNWGNVRKLPRITDAPRAGGYGMYYHYDYVGGPRNYKWLNTSPISRTWEQMHMTYEHGVDRIWIVNVGDIKPMEFPTTFFLDYAWNPDIWPAESLVAYTEYWVEQTFGTEYAVEIADIISQYTKFNGRRKPELLSPDTYSLVNYAEAQTVVADYNAIAAEAESINEALAPEYRDAFFQLVLYPTQACANLNELYVTAAQNRLYATQGRAATNGLADRVEDLFARDAELARIYNEDLGNGRWSHLMDQTHIGYTDWQEPAQNNMPAVQRINVPQAGEMGVAIEGSNLWWPNSQTVARLPELSPFQAPSTLAGLEVQPGRTIEVFNRGQGALTFTATASVPWLQITPATGPIGQQQTLRLSVDWTLAPEGVQTVPVTITSSNGRTVTVQAVVNRPAGLDPLQVVGFVEQDGFVSIEPEHATGVVNTTDVTWQPLADHGRTGGAVTAFPTTAASQVPGGATPHLDYAMHLTSMGPATVQVQLSPTLNYHPEGLRYAVSIDNEAPQIVTMHDDTSEPTWEGRVAANIQIESTTHQIGAPGEHVLHFWMVDPGVVLEKIVVDVGDVRASYFGPPESFFRPAPPAAPAPTENPTP